MYKKRKNKNKKIYKKMKLSFYLFIFIALVLFSILIANLFYNNINCRLKTEKYIIQEDKKTNIEKNKEKYEKNKEEILALVEEVNGTNLKIFDITNNKIINIDVMYKTDIRDKYNKIKSISEFKKGDIVNIKYNTEKDLEYIKESKVVWTLESIKNFHIDKENKIIKIGKDVFNYKDTLKVIYKNKDYNINSLKEPAVLNIKGIDNNVFFVEVLKSYGKLKIINFKDIEKGILEISPKNIISIDEIKEIDKDIDVTEGSYKIILQGKNIETYIKDIDIIEEELTVLDLKDVKYNRSVLTIYVDTPEAKVTIDDKIVDISKTQNLPYGEYNIKVESGGFIPYENKIKIDKPIENLNISLEKELKSKDIDIITIPEDAEVFINEEYIGRSPIKASLDFGEKYIKVRKQGYLEANFPLEVNKNTDKYSITLIPIANKE